MNRSTKAQMGIDFLAGMVVFSLAFIFVSQFALGSVAPFTASSSEETTVMVNKAADELYAEKMSTGESGEVDTDYLSTVPDSDALKGELGIPEARGVNVTVTDISDSVEERFGDDVPDYASVSTAVRVGHDTDSEKTVIIRVRVW